MSDRQQLRKQMRAARRALTPLEQKRAATRLARQLRRHPIFLCSRRIGLYLPADGEMDPGPLLAAALACGKQCYLPVLHPVKHNRLWFVRYRPGCPMTRNIYGIDEPHMHLNPRIDPWTLDLVLMPLVAFDAEGGRLGMGGGYYDRTFAFMRRPQSLPGPMLLGLAHDFQRVERLELASWDIPLRGVATDRHLYLSGFDALRAVPSASY